MVRVKVKLNLTEKTHFWMKPTALLDKNTIHKVRNTNFLSVMHYTEYYTDYSTTNMALSPVIFSPVFLNILNLFTSHLNLFCHYSMSLKHKRWVYLPNLLTIVYAAACSSDTSNDWFQINMQAIIIIISPTSRICYHNVSIKVQNPLR